MVVQDGQRHDLSSLDLDRPLMVDLPEFIGDGPFKALEFVGRGRWGNPVVA
jgi:hypothetical protein